MPPEKYNIIYSNEYAIIERGNYGRIRIYLNNYNKYVYGVKLLNKEPEYLENLIYNIIELYPRLKSEVDEFDFDGKPDRALHLYTTTDDEGWWNIDIIFDPIQASLVEKVE